MRHVRDGYLSSNIAHHSLGVRIEKSDNISHTLEGSSPSRVSTLGPELSKAGKFRLEAIHGLYIHYSLREPIIDEHVRP